MDLVLGLGRSISDVDDNLAELDTKIATTNVIEALTEYNTQREALWTTRKRFSERRVVAMNKLGVEELADVKRFKNSKFYTLRVNAYALLLRIRQRMKNRRFELDRYERSFRSAVNGTYDALSPLLTILTSHAEQNLGQHIGAAMAKRQGATAAYARKYNLLCKEMQALITKRKAPQNAIAPLEIKLEGLFKMDIDHSIWHDLGFNDTEVEVPRWLADESVRTGIRYRLELDRCEEELDRLRFERCGLQEWFMADWQGLQCAKEKGM